MIAIGECLYCLVAGFDSMDSDNMLYISDTHNLLLMSEIHLKITFAVQWEKSPGSTVTLDVHDCFKISYFIIISKFPCVLFKIIYLYNINY